MAGESNPSRPLHPIPLPRGGGVSVYFAQCDRMIKIGKSRNPASRIQSLQTGSFMRVRMLAVAAIESDAASFEIERRLHEQFAWSRRRGEFFKVTPPLQKVIAAVAAGFDVRQALAETEIECRQLSAKTSRLDRCKELTPPVTENAARRRKRLRAEQRGVMR